MNRHSDDQRAADLLTRAKVSTSCCGAGGRSAAAPPQWTVAPLKNPRAFDLVLAEVTELGYGFGDGLLEVQGENGVVATHTLEVGTVFVGSLGDREAEDEWTAELPANIDGPVPTMDLVAGCGLISCVQSGSITEPPTRVRLLGAIHSEGSPATTKPGRLIRPAPDQRSTVILFVADKMNAGKSTAVLACTRALAAAGKTVAAGKITGTTRRRGLVSAVESGARVAQSFADYGYPSTKNIPSNDLRRVFDCIVSGLSAEAAGGYLLLELADGFDQAETKAVLHMVEQQPVDKVILCLSGSGDPARSTELFGAFCSAHPRPDVISGRVATQPDHMRALKSLPGASAVPRFNAAEACLSELGALLIGGTDHAH